MTASPVDFLLVAAGGALGAMSRFGAAQFILFNESKWAVTTLINIVGCLLIGVVFALSEHFTVARGWTLFIITGFLGGFTTYSAFSLDVVKLFTDGKVAEAVTCALVTLVGCVLACGAGYFAVTRILKF